METNREMYQEQILFLYKNPKNYGKLEGATHHFHGVNASCGDDITFELAVVKGEVTDVRFNGKSCAICMASASLVSEAVKGKKVEMILKMGKEEILKLLGVEVNAARMKCALLPIETVRRALADD